MSQVKRPFESKMAPMTLQVPSGVRACSVHATAAVLIAFAAATAGAHALQQTGNQPRAATRSSSDGGLPPLIDRELFFGNPEISTGTISPDGRYIAFRKPWNGTMNIWVKGVAEPFAQAKRLTAETRRPIPAYFWSRDSKYIVFVQDQLPGIAAA